MSDLDHLEQSINDILTTPIGTRVLKRDYGSSLFEMIDGPIDPLSISYAVSDALVKFEPRISVKSVNVGTTEQGKLNITINGVYKGSNVSIDFKQ